MVLKDLMADGTIPSRSSHPSLRAHNTPDLKYVIIDNTYINDILLTVKQKITLNIYNFVKYIGSDDFKAWGVSSHNVEVESAPITELQFTTIRLNSPDTSVTTLNSLTFTIISI
jgi:KUP system potassium uptake protein